MDLSANNRSPVKWLELLQEQVSSLRYGIIQIVVHDRRVVQIERTEKFRLERAEVPSTAERL